MRSHRVERHYTQGGREGGRRVRGERAEAHRELGRVPLPAWYPVAKYLCVEREGCAVQCVAEKETSSTIAEKQRQKETS